MVGLGPGAEIHRTPAALNALDASEVVVGYAPYIDAVRNRLDGKEVIRSGMKGELDRVRQALDLAMSGRDVALVSSGDAGVYGMAGLVLELAEARNYDGPIEIVPGMTAAQAAAAALGAPLMLDWAVVSLSDLMSPGIGFAGNCRVSPRATCAAFSTTPARAVAQTSCVLPWIS